MNSIANARAQALSAGRGNLRSLETLLDGLVNGSIAGIGFAANKFVREGGSGIVGIAAAYATSVLRVGDIITSRVLIDLAGLRSTAADDIIGDNGAGTPCHLGQITTARNGTIIAGSILCLELPTGGDPDIDLYSAVEATGVEDAAISTLDETQLVNSGDHTLGGVKILTAFPADGEFLYLVAGATTDADYTAGKLLIEFQGIAA